MCQSPQIGEAAHSMLDLRDSTFQDLRDSTFQAFSKLLQT
jgi:hypothetical protein